MFGLSFGALVDTANEAFENGSQLRSGLQRQPRKLRAEATDDVAFKPSPAEDKAVQCLSAGLEMALTCL